MKKRILLPVLFMFALTSTVTASNLDKDRLLSDFKSAVEAADQDKIKSLIIVSDNIEPKHANALASIYADLLGKRLEKSIVSNMEKMELINKRRVNSMMARSMAFMIANPVFILENGEINTTDGLRFIEAERNGKQSLRLLEIDGRTKFWPTKIEPTDDLIEFAEFLSDYRSVVETSSIDEIKQNFDKLVIKYVKGTSLEFKNQEIQAMVNGEKAPVKSVIITYTEFRGKERLSLKFMNVEEIEKCGNFQPKLFSIDLPVSGENLYDFSLLGINGSLQVPNRSVGVRDGKIEFIKIDENTFKGRIAAEKDENNSIYGNFTAKVCK